LNDGNPPEDFDALMKAAMGAAERFERGLGAEPGR